MFKRRVFLIVIVSALMLAGATARRAGGEEKVRLHQVPVEAAPDD